MIPILTETEWVKQMIATKRPKTQRFTLSGVSWRAYEQVLRAFDDRHLRITYDDGELEIMTLSPGHERYKHLLGRLVCALADELEWNIAGFGSMTFKRKAKKKGLEPDECYWIQNVELVGKRTNINLQRDPPPDLVAEIDVTHSSINRMDIYASLGVPEVWVLQDGVVQSYQLSDAGDYVVFETSLAFPFLELSDLDRFLEMQDSYYETDLIRQFRKWVRERIADNWA